MIIIELYLPPFSIIKIKFKAKSKEIKISDIFLSDNNAF